MGLAPHAEVVVCFGSLVSFAFVLGGVHDSNQFTRGQAEMCFEGGGLMFHGSGSQLAGSFFLLVLVRRYVVDCGVVDRTNCHRVGQLGLYSSAVGRRAL